MKPSFLYGLRVSLATFAPAVLVFSYLLVLGALDHLSSIETLASAAGGTIAIVFVGIVGYAASYGILAFLEGERAPVAHSREFYRSATAGILLAAAAWAWGHAEKRGLVAQLTRCADEMARTDASISGGDLVVACYERIRESDSDDDGQP